MNENQKHFNEILDDFSVAMLTTLGSDDLPRARPMQIAGVDKEHELCFFTDGRSGKIDEIQSDSTVGITMQGGGKFLSLTGKANIIRDQEKIDEHWTDMYKVWFPEGKNSPSLVLLKIIPDEGEYWDTSGISGLRYMFRAGQAYFTGEGIDTEGLDVNAKVNF